MEAPSGAEDTTSGPKIIRPIPRRPFALSLKSPTPPDEDSTPGTPASQQQQRITAHDLRFLNPHQGPSSSNNDTASASVPDSLSRATSLMNLTSSTLFGIYSPSSPTSSDRRAFDRTSEYERDESSFTPWGTGAETPATRRRPGLDEETYRLMRNRSSGVASSSLAYNPQSTDADSPTRVTKEGSSSPMSSGGSSIGLASSLFIRGVLLFALGMGYGVLVTRLPSSSRAQRQQHNLDPATEQLNWGYLTFWGGAGVALGCLLPWFDQVWEESFGKRRQQRPKIKSANKPSSGKTPVGGQDDGDQESPSPPPAQQQQQTTAPQPATDWALVMRGIGAFVGIVFAIRRLPWTSTMQVSLTLALTNPILWYLIDRSKPGFLLSAAVGVFGSLSVLVAGRGGFVGGVLPAPFSAASAAAASFAAGRIPGGSGANGTTHTAPYLNGNGVAAGSQGGLTSQENIEAGIWMLTILFCSCVCFGNIGRRLALNRSAAARGRWGGVR